MHGPGCDHGHDHATPTGTWTWVGVFFGLAMHTIIDGLALGAAVKADWQHASAESWLGLAGFGYFLAVLLHKPFDSLSITSLMHLAGWSKKSMFWVNLSYALIAPIGVGMFYFVFNNIDIPEKCLARRDAGVCSRCLHVHRGQRPLARVALS